MQEQIRILIGYDGSPSANAALDDLRRAGLPRNAAVSMLTVREVWLPALAAHEFVASAQASLSTPVVANSKIRHTQSAAAVVPMSEAYSLALEAMARLQSRFPAWVINVEESSGSPAHEILKRADELKPHLIVLGCQGQTALGGFLLGSVSQKVINEARCTVRVCRGTAWKDGSPVRILIGLDGTSGSELAVNAVAARVWPTSSAVRLIAVVDPDQGAMGSSSVPPQTKNSSWTRGMKRDLVQKFMKAAVKKLSAAQLSVSPLIEEGDPKRVLIANAEEWGADSIFLGASASNSVLEKYLLGSVATAVVARAHCSVEVVRLGY